jgi:hypothetical protein
VKAALMSMFTNWKALAALLVAMGAFITEQWSSPILRPIRTCID